MLEKEKDEGYHKLFVVCLGFIILWCRSDPHLSQGNLDAHVRFPKVFRSNSSLHAQVSRQGS